MTDEELAKFTGLYPDPRWPQAVKKFTPEQRAVFERMANLEMELKLWQDGLGPKPAGVLIDTERSTRRRRAWR
jgi:hypothetical protein